MFFANAPPNILAYINEEYISQRPKLRPDLREWTVSQDCLSLGQGNGCDTLISAGWCTYRVRIVVESGQWKKSLGYKNNNVYQL